MRSGAGSMSVASTGAASTPGGDGRPLHRQHPLQQEQTHDATPALQALQTQHSRSQSPGHKQQPQQQQQQQQSHHQQQQQQQQPQHVPSSDSGDGDDGDDRSDVDGDDDGTGVRTGKRKRPISVS
ncbi:MAG: hypothetical protein STHCBS139747_000748 [Sporothrix thermara]